MASGMGSRKVDRVRRHEWHIDGELLARDVLRQFEQDGTRPLLAHAEASRTSVGMLAALTIWREDFVNGFIVATMSTIWNRPGGPS